MTMKKMLALMLTLLLAFSLAACGGTSNPAVDTATDPAVDTPGDPDVAQEVVQAPENPTIRLSTTTSVNDSGLLSYLQPEFEKDTGYKLEITSAGSGAAIEKGRTGDADCLLTHSPAAEETFIGEGYGEMRNVFMYNYFVIVGPLGDPVGVADCSDASEAFTKIAEDSGASFVSRGDNSGTHNAELAIWKIAEIDPEGESWYISAGQGMGASLTIASETGSYILTDKATYLAHERRAALNILLEESDEMINIYSVIAISDQRWNNTNADGSAAFIAWINSDKAKSMINEYGVAQYGEGLFFAN